MLSRILNVSGRWAAFLSAGASGELVAVQSLLQTSLCGNPVRPGAVGIAIDAAYDDFSVFVDDKKVGIVKDFLRSHRLLFFALLCVVHKRIAEFVTRSRRSWQVSFAEPRYAQIY